LPAGHPVVEIVQDQETEVEVPSTAAEHMGAANAQSTVSHDDHYRKLGAGEFQASPIGQRPAVEPMQGMGIEKRIK
jgi:hypothetical protein